MSYVGSVYLHQDKSIFKIEELPPDLFAESLDLPGTPKIRFTNTLFTVPMTKDSSDPNPQSRRTSTNLAEFGSSLSSAIRTVRQRLAGTWKSGLCSDKAPWPSDLFF